MRLQFKFNRSLRHELAPGDRRLWLLRAVALRIERHTNPLWAFEIYHRRLILIGLVLGLLGYLTAATALYAWLDRQPHNQVGWTDIAAPWRWRDLRARRGDSAIAAGKTYVEAQNYADAFYQFRVGLARSPGNTEGRLTLFRLLAHYDSSRALTLLEDGLVYRPDDPLLVGTLFDFYAHLQARDRALDTVERLLEGGPADAVRPMLLRTRVSLLLQGERLAEAEAALAASATPTAVDGPEAWLDLRLELLRRSGRTDAALPLVDAVLADSSASVADLRQVGEVAVARADAAMLQSVIRRLRAREPEAPGPYLYAIQSLQRLSRGSLRDDYVREYLDYYRGDDAALQVLAGLGVSLGLPDLVIQARQVAVASGFSPFAYQVNLTELALRLGDSIATMSTLPLWEQKIETLDVPQRFHPELIKRLAGAVYSGTPDRTMAVLAHLSANPFFAQLAVYELAIAVLETAGRLEAADQLVRAGRQTYPYSEPMLVADRRRAARSVRVGPGPVAGPELSVAVVPATGEEALAQLDRDLAAGAFADANALLKNVRAAQPDWMSQYDESLGLREVELACFTLEPLAGRAVARAYSDRYRSEAAGLQWVALLRRLVQRDRITVARLLADDLLTGPAATAAMREAVQALGLAVAGPNQLATLATALAALDGYVAGADREAAERLLRQLDDQPPAWLEDGFIEVKVRVVQVRLSLGQRPQALAALKELLVKGGAARSAAFTLVRDLLARDEQEQARVLAREIRRLLPGNPAAERLVQEAEAPRES